MTELNSSLCQLNWLIAKEGLGCTETTGDVEAARDNVPQKTAATEKPADETSNTSKLYDGVEKPPYSYSQLIRFAIESKEEKKSTLADIYAYIIQHFAFYRENRSGSWKNSIRHNLSLNKQFHRIERMNPPTGKHSRAAGGWWVCVEPPEKKPRILKGPPVRVNPIYQQMFLKSTETQVYQPAEAIETNQPTEDSYLTVHEEVRELTEKEINDLNLFESYDLNSSFRDVYDQIFEKPTPNVQQKAAQIDWLKISLEAAGLDYHDEQDMQVVDTAKLKDYVHNGFPAELESEVSTPRTESSSDSSSECNISSGLKYIPNDDESDDDFDWNRIL